MNAAGLGETSSFRHAFRPLVELGRGGTARVYLAESLASGIRKLVVLKVLNPEFCANPAMRASFRREAELAAQMNHPNVVQVMDVVEHLGAPVIVMEYLEGTSLSVLRRQAGNHLPLPLHMYILSQVLAGLHHFHELRDLDGQPLNAVHRDVSPQNVMVLHDGPVKVLDFGIAKINALNDQSTRTGTVKGKVHYMPPEQLLGAAGIDRRADVFAVGVMLWEAAAKRRMWEGLSETALLRALATGSLPRLRDVAPDVPACVLQIVDRATDIQRENRFATAQEMQAAIESAIAQQSWGVQTRELAAFMSQHFGENRRALEREIKNALRTPMSSDVMTCAPAPGSSGGSVPHNDSANPTAISDGASSLLTNRRNWGWAMGVFFCLTLAGGWMMKRQKPSLQDASGERPPATATLEIEALPPGAEILLDGKLIGKDHYVGSHPLTDRRLELEVRAPSYLSERREITLRSETALTFMLKPDPAAAQSAISAAIPSSGAASSVASSPPSRTRPSSGSLAPSKPSAPSRSNGSSKCNPPYTFSADGVKTYKPECF